MNFTPEQQAILNSSGNIKINAVAGSGKTTTIIEYANTRPKGSRILYLAFNKSVKIDASKRFIAKNLYNVKVETAHSLAYKAIVHRSNYKLTTSYKTYEIANLLKLRVGGDKHNKYIVANHINKFAAYFCNSNAQKVQELNYLDTITDNLTKDFVITHYDKIEYGTRLLLAKMNKAEVNITHDFYLKKFQLCKPILHFDYILFDEGQDASPAMLDIFFNQEHATKVIVGDTHQQIYGWRYAINSLEQTKYKNYSLSTSFRFNQDIANLATDIIHWKKIIGIVPETYHLGIKGKGNTNKVESKAVLARTNLGLLLKAIENVTENTKLNNIYFEGNINSYTYADEGTSLYDVLNLYNGKKKMVRDKLIQEMRSIEELQDYIDKTDDVQLGLMVEIVKEYKNEIPNILKTIKEKHIKDNDKENAQMIFSTIHRCKGMEYDSVQLANDFITENKLVAKRDGATMDINFSKLKEEINLLYVAVTRAKNKLYIPESLLPKDFPTSQHIQKLKVLPKSEQKEKIIGQQKRSKNSTKKEKQYTHESVRANHRDAYQPWTFQLEEELSTMFLEGINVNDLAKHFGRTKGAIRSRLRKMGLN